MRTWHFPVLILVSSYALAADPPPNPVESKLSELRTRPDVTIEVKGGWTIASDKAGMTTWSFTPPTHAAHPAYVERRMSQRDGAWYIAMNVKCGASKAACDQLIAEFQAMNEQIRETMNSLHPSG